MSLGYKRLQVEHIRRVIRSIDIPYRSKVP